ncbi:MAG: phosphate acetyltransferase [Candidatus Cloacimonadota bacterium]|nr:MAG: phosphate acetyltransferase [Candidatus Cloacimonadota bacterium]
MNPFMKNLMNKAKSNLKNIVFPESNDERILKAAEFLLAQNICEVSLIGNKSNLISKGFNIQKAHFFDPEDESISKELIESYYDLRKKKGISWVEAKRQLKTPITFATMLLKHKKVDGLVSGAVSPTADVLRAGIQIIKPAPGNKTVSSFFIMIMPDTSFGKDGILFFADCAVIPNPDANQLSDIALATASNYEKLVGDIPKVAMLSFSTKGSAKHPDVDKVTEAFKILQSKNSKNYLVDAELQLDAAIIDAIANKKAPESNVAGNANILVFPTLDAGNIGYKLVQRFAKAEAYGPIIQGLNQPMNDLSRGCSYEDVINVAILTSIQS